jgi:hypothetical protein
MAAMGRSLPARKNVGQFDVNWMGKTVLVPTEKNLSFRVNHFYDFLTTVVYSAKIRFTR